MSAIASNDGTDTTIDISITGDFTNDIVFELPGLLATTDPTFTIKAWAGDFGDRTVIDTTAAAAVAIKGAAPTAPGTNTANTVVGLP
mmetsp:Transcript_26536/g.4654  ORF Transcript_26536/g.4654 Transcript_26536/m.4654 type:complete len:87 (+) Transcript_26536:10531-10791(+)